MNVILYNSYDKNKWHEAHKRAIARAAPICYAFDCNLVVMNFPCDKNDIISINTTIGDSGMYLKNLIKNNRFIITDKYQAQFGTPIISTSKPENSKSISPRELANYLLKKPCGIIIGLGRHGLPKNIIKLGEYHLDITEKRVSLETCTAISAIPSVISTYLKSIYD